MKILVIEKAEFIYRPLAWIFSYDYRSYHTDESQRHKNLGILAKGTMVIDPKFGNLLTKHDKEARKKMEMWVYHELRIQNPEYAQIIYPFTICRCSECVSWRKER